MGVGLSLQVFGKSVRFVWYHPLPAPTGTIPDLSLSFNSVDQAFVSHPSSAPLHLRPLLLPRF